MKKPLTSLLLLLLVVAPAFSAELFVDLKFEAACQQAAKENKLVLIDFYTTWCGPCKLLDKNTWTDPEVIKQVSDKAVALRIDAEKETGLASRYKIDVYPTILLLKPDGTQVDRLVGYREPKAFLADFTAALSGKDSVARAVEAVKQAGTNDPMARMQLGKSLAGQQKHAEALKEYLWCFDQGAEADPGFVGVRVSFLLSDIVSLGRVYPPARQALESRRDERETKVLSGSANQETVRDLLRLNETLGQPEKNLALFDHLVVGNPARNIVLESITEQLLAARRYRDVLAGNDPEAILKKELEQSQQGLSSLPKSNPNRKRLERSYRQRSVSTGAHYFEALAGMQRSNEAETLADHVLKFDNTAATRDRLAQAAERAGNTELAKNVRSRKVEKTATED